MRYSLPITFLSLSEQSIAPVNSGSVQCYLTDLPEIWQEYPTDTSLVQLSQQERARLERITHIKSRECFLAGRTLIRHILSHYLKISPANICIETSVYGKPFQSHQSRLSFNLSHTGEQFALAISESGEVGVDIEQYKQRKNLDGMVQQVLTESEQEWFYLLPEEHKTENFYRLWSLKEAILKSEGVGMTLPMKAFGFTDELCVSEWSEVLGPVGNWRWSSVQYNNMSIALALKG